MKAEVFKFYSTQTIAGKIAFKYRVRDKQIMWTNTTLIIIFGSGQHTQFIIM